MRCGEVRLLERITVGVVQQNEAGTAEDCVASCPSCLEQQKRGRIVVRDYDYTEARGGLDPLS